MLVKINKRNFLILEVDNFEDCPKNIEEAFGHTSYIEQIIRINKNLKPEQKKQTLMHELTHAYMWCYGYGQITDQIPVEIMCDFIGCFAEEIVETAKCYIKRNTEEAK